LKLVNLKPKWESLNAPETILKVLKGYRIPFTRKPPLSILSYKNCKTFEPKLSIEMSEQIDKLININAISLNGFRSGYISPIFLRKKNDTSDRLIFNLKQLNFYIKPSKF
jgi:hypothetical protein